MASDYREMLDRVALLATKAMLSLSPAAAVAPAPPRSPPVAAAAAPAPLVRAPPIGEDGFTAREREMLAGLPPATLASLARLLQHLDAPAAVSSAASCYWGSRKALLPSPRRH